MLHNFILIHESTESVEVEDPDNVNGNPDVTGFWGTSNGEQTQPSTAFPFALQCTNYNVQMQILQYKLLPYKGYNI